MDQFKYNLDDINHHPIMEELVSILNRKTQNQEKPFFRAIICYFFGKLAASMRVSIDTQDRGNIPVNIYTVALAPSGYAKGHSVTLLETEVFAGFKDKLQQYTIPTIAQKYLNEIGTIRAVAKNTNQEEEIEKAHKEYTGLGTIPFTFDSGTVPAVKQLRQALLMVPIGAINLQIDEIASNLLGSTELLNLYLELYDQGLVKQKLIKNTVDNVRAEDLQGKTPANMLLFGTPTKLFDGDSIERHFTDFLDIGYARRCLFANGNLLPKDLTKTVEEIYEELISKDNSEGFIKWKSYFTNLAEPEFHQWKLLLNKPEAIILLSYKLHCEALASELPETDAIGKAELSHRYFKALKLSGALAFVNMDTHITKDTLLQAIKLVNESGEAFNLLRARDKTYVRLAKYIANVNTPVTHADLLEALSFYKTSSTARNEMMALATAWGYKRHIIIKKSVVSGIEIFTGETLKEANINELMCSYSFDLAKDYEPASIEFSQLPILASTTENNFRLQWCNHAFEQNHRSEKNVIQGFNLIVLDIDNGVQADYVHSLLKEYIHFIYTTKRSTPEQNRFRLIIPMSHILYLNENDYRDFMRAVLEWLPFNVDEQANQRSRKWESYENTQIYSNSEGTVLDILNFIPHTTKYEENQNMLRSINSMDALQKWFFSKITQYGRNNTLLRYALALYDAGDSLQDAKNKVENFNKQLTNPLTKTELNTTIFVTLAKKYI